MKIEFPQGSIYKFDGEIRALPRPLRVEITDEKADMYFGRLVEVDDDKDKAGS